MGKVGKLLAGVAMVAVGVVVPGAQFLIGAGLSTSGSALLSSKGKASSSSERAASSATVQLGEVSRQAIFGEAATAGSLADAFNYGGKYGTDWEVYVLALADHRCEALTGFYVNDQFVPFTGDGPVDGFKGQLCVWWRPGTEDQTVPDILLQHGPGWTPDDNGAGVSHVTVAFKCDEADAKDPVWPGGRPRFLWVVRGALCYSARADSSVGGSGAQRWATPTTRAWSTNPIDCRYTWVRGLYACDRVGDPSQLMIGRGLTAVEAPPANVFARANLCDELVDGNPRYRVSAIVETTAPFIDIEQDFAAACAGTIVQPQGSVEIDPGEARAIVATITDDDLVIGTKVTWNNGMLGVASPEWVNTVIARYIEPSLRWADHAAPVRRAIPDVLADRQPREERIQLGFVTDGAQAGRVAEIRRRLGRLPGRGSVTLPPRFAFLEEGDWIVWHSPRRFQPRFGVDALTFRIEAWGSDAGWRHQVSLRQISASVYSETAPLDDGAVAIAPPVIPAIGAPAPGSWSVEAGYQDAGDLQTPVLIVTGQSDDPAARFIKVEYREETGAGSVAWTDVGVAGPDVTRREIPLAAGGRYSVAVSYVVNGVPGDRLLLGPLDLGRVLLPDGSPIQSIADPATLTVKDKLALIARLEESDAWFASLSSEFLALDPAPLVSESVVAAYEGAKSARIERAAVLVEISPPLFNTDASSTVDRAAIDAAMAVVDSALNAFDTALKTRLPSGAIVSSATAPERTDLAWLAGPDALRMWRLEQAGAVSLGDRPIVLGDREWEMSAGHDWLDTVDRTAAVAPRVDGPATVQIAADANGVTTTPLPKTVQVFAFEGETDVTAEATFALETPPAGIVAEINAASVRGRLAISKADVAGDLNIRVQFPRGGAGLKTIKLQRTRAGQGNAGGAGSASASTAAWVDPTSTAHAAITPVLTVKSSAAGELIVQASASFQANTRNDSNVWIKAAYRAVSTTSWSDAGAEVLGSAAIVGRESSLPAYKQFQQDEYLEPNYDSPGYVDLPATTITSLTPSTNYEIVAFARLATAGRTISWLGDQLLTVRS